MFMFRTNLRALMFFNLVLTLTVLTQSTLLGQQPAIETLRSWISSFHGVEITGNARIFEDGERRPNVSEKLYFSKDENTCIAERFSFAEGIRARTDIFGVVGKYALSSQWWYVESGESGGVVSKPRGSNTEAVCDFLNMLAVRHLFLRSRELGKELFPIIESRKDWMSRSEGEKTVFQSGAGNDALVLTVSSNNPAWPESIAHEWPVSSQNLTFRAHLLLKFAQPTKFDGIDHELPGLTTAKIRFAGEKVNQEVEEAFQLLSVKKRLKDVKTWSDMLTVMPDGLEVTVEHLRQTKFEWQKNDIVRSVDGKKLSEIE